MANEYGEIENLVNDVTSLDTARMTLRWALERLNNIEKEKADLKKNLALAEETSKRLQVKEASLTDAYSSRNKTLEEKEDFYTKLEATMSLLGEGKLDIQQLLKKEAKLDSLRHSLESEYSDKFEELDRNQRSVIERWNSRLLEVESQYAGRLAEAQKKYDGLRAGLEGDYQGRINSLQASFTSREKFLSERISGLEKSVHQSEEKVETRRRELEGEYLAKKREAEENYRKLRNMLEAGLEEKIRAADSDHAEQVRSFEASWQIERARLLEEQHVREAQFASAQDRIKEIENALALQQETHHSELLKIISGKETAFRAQLAVLEAEKSAKEATVRELRGRLEKKADALEADRARLQSEFDGRLGSMEAGLRERAASLEETFQRREKELGNVIAAGRAESEKEFSARLLEREEALAVNAARIKELENAVLATREEHHRDLMERLRSGEDSFREKLAGFESEKQAFNAKIAALEAGYSERMAAAHAEAAGKMEFERQNWRAERSRFENALTETCANFSGAQKEIEALNVKLRRAVVEYAGNEERFNRALAEARAEYEKGLSFRVKESVAIQTADLAEALEAALARQAELSAALEEKENSIGALKAELTLKYTEELNSAAKDLKDAAKAREAELYGDVQVLRSELAERDLLLAAERKKLAEELSKASEEGLSRTEERTAAVRSEYERRLAAQATLADSDIRKLKTALAEKEELLEKSAQKHSYAEKTLRVDFERRVSELEEIISSGDATREAAELETRRAWKLELNKAVSEAVDSAVGAEKSAWQSEKERLDNCAADMLQRFSSAQKELSALSLDNRKLREKVMESEARLNSQIVAIEAAAEKAAEERLQAAVNTRTAAVNKALSDAAASAAAAEREHMVSARAAKEEAAYLKDTVTGLKKELAEAYVRMNDRDAEFVLNRKTYQVALIKLQQEHAVEFEMKMKEAVEAAVYSATCELSAAREEITKLRSASEEQRKNLLIGESEAEIRLKQAGGRIFELETELAKRKVEASKELIDKVTEQEEKRLIFMQEMQEKYARKEKVYAARIKEDQERYDSHLSELEKMLEEKMRSVEGEKSMLVKRLSDLGRVEAEVVTREKQIIDDKIRSEKETEEKRQELERAYNKKLAEVEKLRTELAKTIIEYKK